MNANKDNVTIQQALSAGESFEESGLPESMRSRWDEMDKEYKWFKANDLQMEVVSEWSDWSSETLEGLMTPLTGETLARWERLGRDDENDEDDEDDEKKVAKEQSTTTSTPSTLTGSPPRVRGTGNYSDRMPI